MRNPCYQCTRRNAECHAHCEDYAGWMKARKAAKDAERQKHEADVVLIENSIKIRNKMLERKKKGGL